METDSMLEFRRCHAIRVKYPVILSNEQQVEILQQLPEYPERDDMVELAISHNAYNFQDESERELYNMYQIKVCIGKLKSSSNDYIGVLLPTYLIKFFSILSDYVMVSESQFGKSKAFAKELYDKWMELSSESGKLFTKEQIQERIDIIRDLDVNYPERLKDRCLQKFQAYEFLESLIKN